jgi:CheY-like chemotaxis protein
MRTLPEAGCTILVCDDDKMTRDVYGHVLKNAFYTVIEASSGADCLRKMYTQRVDLLVLDLMMAGLSGWDVMHVKSNDPTICLIPTIIITGLEPSLARKKPLIGAALILEKPFSNTMLIYSVDKLLRG